jgi:hypothetical protein
VVAFIRAVDSHCDAELLHIRYARMSGSLLATSLNGEDAASLSIQSVVEHVLSNDSLSDFDALGDSYQRMLLPNVRVLVVSDRAASFDVRCSVRLTAGARPCAFG